MHGHQLTDFVTLGRSGLRVSPLCLGAMTFGTEWGIGVGPEESERVLSAYLEAGGNFIDTANIYTKGHSEKILGDYFARGPGRGRRHRVVIATKFMGNLWPNDPNGGGASRKAVLHAVEDSLRRLQTDHIDLLWAHFWDRHTPVEEMMSAMDFLVKQGKVRYLGLSDHPAWVVTKCQYTALMRGWEPLCALQIEYSLVQRSVEAELMTMARDLGLGVTPWSPLRGGVLSGKFDRATPPPSDGSTRVKKESTHLNDRAYAIIDLLRAIAAERGCSVAQVALRWLLDRDGVTSVIIGARHLDQLRDNLGCCSVRLTADDHRRLDEASRVERPFPWDFLDFVRDGIQNGTTINGVASGPWHLTPKSDAERF
jgi:aryl-alcohol dehydrogenase-like predicted oxidoreductase